MSQSNNTPSPNESSSLSAEVDRLAAALDSAEKTIRELRTSLEAAQAERDSYKESLYAMIPFDDDPPFTKEEMEHLLQHGVTWDVIEQDLKTILES